MIFGDDGNFVQRSGQAQLFELVLRLPASHCAPIKKGSIMIKSIFLLLFLFTSSYPITIDTTILGGCNTSAKTSGQSGRVLKTSSSLPGLTPDSIYFHGPMDSIQLFVGLSDDCCLPFATYFDESLDSVNISIQDTDKTRACFCYCYYTFNYYLKNIEQKRYHFIISLDDIHGYSVLYDGYFDINRYSSILNKDQNKKNIKMERIFASQNSNLIITNPFHNSDIKIYNISGKLIEHFPNYYKETFVWNTNAVLNGEYFIVIQYKESSHLYKVLFIK
jgi:hypothetical protein